MSFLFILALHDIPKYCIRAGNESLPQCPNGTTTLNTIDEFYKALNPEQTVDLLVINDKDSEIPVQSNLLNGCSVDFSGYADSIINFTLVAEENYSTIDRIGFKNITVRLNHDVNFNFELCYLNEVKFIFNEGKIKLHAKRIDTDLRSISYFDIVNATDFHLLTTDNLPKSNTTIYVRSTLTVEAQSSKSRVDISPNELLMNYDGTIIIFKLEKTESHAASCLIEHDEPDTLMDVYIHNVERTSDIDALFTINATNKAIVDVEYNAYTKNVSPQVKVYLSGDAVMSTSLRNSPVTVLVEGNATFDITKNLNNPSYQSLTIQENSKLTIDNSYGHNSIEFTGFVSLNKNGILAAKEPINISTRKVALIDTVEVPGSFENIKFNNIMDIDVKNSTAAIPFLNTLKNANYKFNYDVNTIKAIKFGTFQFSGKTTLNFNGVNVPDDADVQPLVDNEQYVFCADNLDCNSWNFNIESEVSDNEGFTESTSIFNKVCKQVGNTKCAGFQLIDTPAHVYPKFCFGKLCQSAFIVDSSNSSEIGNLVRDSARRIRLEADDDMNEAAFGFKGLSSNVEVEINSLTSDTVTNIMINENEKFITKLTFKNGNITFVDNKKINLPLIVFDQGCQIQKSVYDSLELSPQTNVEITFNALGQFPVDYFPSAIIPITNGVTIEYNESTWILTSEEFPDQPTEIQTLMQTFDIVDGGSLKIKKTKDGINIKPIKLSSTSDKFSVQLMNQFAEKDVALKYTGKGKLQLETESQYIPITFQNCDATLKIVSANSDLKLAPQEFNNTELKISTDKQKVILPNSTLTNTVKLSGKNVEVNAVTFDETARATFSDLTMTSNITIPKAGNLICRYCNFNDNTVTILSEVQGKSGTFNIEKVTALPKEIIVQWTASNIPSTGLSAQSYVVIFEEGLEQIKKITKLDSSVKTVNGRSVTAEILYDNTGAFVKFEAPADSKRTMYVALITAGSVALVAFIIGISVYCCFRRSKSGEAKLLSAETLLSLNTTV